MDDHDQFRRDQKAIADLVVASGFDHVPLNDDTLRPFLTRMWDAATRHDITVWVFDVPQFPERLYHGLRGSKKQMMAVAKELQSELLTNYPREEIARARPIVTVAKVTTLYFEGVWIPKAVLKGRSN